MKSLRILIWGYGKMGQAVEKAALSRGHQIVERLDYSPTLEELTQFQKSCDVAIEFSHPDSVVTNIKLGLSAELPMVVGTTGWYTHLADLQQYCENRKGRLIWGSNFSPGVNLLFHLNQHLAAILSKFPEYTPEIKEIHHVHKADAPSGTAISLARGILGETQVLKGYSLARESDSLYIDAQREGNVHGFHEVKWKGPFDSIGISHEAHSREGFSTGAILAAEWIVLQKSGWYSTADLYNFA